jgi:mycofactocin precursor
VSEPSTETIEVAADPSPLAPTPAEPAVPAEAASADALVEQELLVEDVSIDGMCGVY